MTSEQNIEEEVVYKVLKVLAKNLETQKGVKIDSNELLVMDDKLEKGWTFNPKSKTDFIEKRVYGRIVGDDIVDHYILHMSGKCTDLHISIMFHSRAKSSFCVE